MVDVFERPSPRRSVLAVAVAIALGVLYEAGIFLASGHLAQRFPTPYAVPIFDTPFALVAIGVGYLCLERHRLRQDMRSAGMGTTLWLTALLAVAHIVVQPDYPANPGMNAGIAPYMFFLGYLAGLLGIGLAAQYGERPLELTDRARFAVGAGVVALSAFLMAAVWWVRPLLPSLVMAPGRVTPFGVALGGLVVATAGAWALWSSLRRYLARGPFAGYLLLAAYVWVLGLLGFMIYPFRYSIPWYLAGLARPLGVGVIFVGLLREQVWLYREARARQRDLDLLHRAGHALIRNLESTEIARTIATKAVEIVNGAAAVLFRFDELTGNLVPIAHAGAIGDELASRLDVRVAPAPRGRPLPPWRPFVASLDGQRPGAFTGFGQLRDAGFRHVMAIPLSRQSGEIHGALAVFDRSDPASAGMDLELLAAFGTQASVALENGRVFDRLVDKARHDQELHDFSQRLLEASAEEAIREQAVQLTGRLLGADCAGLFLFDAGAGCLRLEAGVGWQAGMVGTASVAASPDSFAGYSFVHKRPLEAEDLWRERRFAVPPYLAAHDIRAGLTVPVGVADQPIGILGAYYRAPRRFDPEERRVAASIAQQTALALAKARLYAELQAKVRELEQTQHQLIQADKLKALGTLLSGVAHELNNPLSTIQLSAQLLERQPDVPDPIRARMRLIEGECGRAARIIRELLAFARRKAPERRRVDLNDVVRAALTLQAPDFDLHRIRIVTALEATPPIWADAHQLQQVLLNLFSNATHALKSTAGDRVITVRSAAHGDQVSLVVEDNGPGIPQAHLAQVFDPFFTTKPAGEGTGLGLSLCIGIVEAHGGTISVENAPAAGARFTIRLPIGRSTEPDEAPRTSAPAVRNAHILVLEDETPLRTLLVDVFTTLGHRVDEAATGGAAIRLLEQGGYDVVLLDLMLPDMDGRSVWEWILAHRPALARRVVFMTGDTASAGSQRFLQDVRRPVLHKPLAMDRLGRTIDDVMVT